MNEQSIVDKTMRSVFVGNIPYEVSEEKLKDIFSEVGPVMSFKLVFDRDSGKPKGYGFCEYKDQETALCAMRNLNNYEIAGRNLRVDNACTEKSRLEMQSLMQSAQVESTHGEAVSPERAPEAISKVVASLPPEQMFELMKQMKLVIQNNPTEARQMLLQNPQLSYALLQVMVIMKIIDPMNALSMLHPANTPSATLASTNTTTITVPTVNNVSTTSTEHNAVSSSDSKPSSLWNNVKKPNSVPQNLGTIQPPPMPPMVAGQDFDLRATPVNRFADSDLRNLQMPTAFPAVDMFKRDPRLQQISENMPTFQGIVPPPGLLPPPNMPLPLPIPGPGMPVLPNMPNMPRMVPPPATIPHSNRTQQPLVTSSTPTTAAVANPPPNAAPLLSAVGNDSEKANLIMRVLKLTDEEMALLPAEHRQSILALKDQIAKSAGKR